MNDERNYWTQRLNRRRFLRSSLGVAALGGLVMAGCGSNNNKNTSGTKNAATSAATTASTSTSAAGTPSPSVPKSINATPAAAAAKVKTGGTLTLGIARDATVYDSAKSQDVYSGYVEGLVLEGLFTTAPNSQGGYDVVGNLIDKIETPDPTTLIWHLHPGIKFQDGTDFNADAVRWNLQRHIDDKSSVRHQDVTIVTGMTVVDPLTLQVKLSAPNAPFYSKLTAGAGYMYSPTQFQKVGADAVGSDLTGLGTGAFTFGSWQKNVQIVVNKNPNYWRKDPNGLQYPYLDKVILKPIPDENTREANLKTGDIDFIEAPPPKDIKSLQSNPDITYRQVPGLNFAFITLNTQKPPFDKKEVRQAFSYAINRQEIVDTVLFGVAVPADTEIPGILPGSKLGPYMKQDIEKAKSLLQQAGTPNVSFSMQYSSNSPVIEAEAQLIQQQVKPAGIDVKLQPIEFATLVSNADKGDYQAGLLGWNGSADPDGFVYPLFKTGAGFNLSKISDPELDALLDKGQQTLDPAQRVQIYHQIIDKLIDLQPFIIFDWGVFSQTSRKNVQNWQLGPSAFTQIYMVWKS